MAPDNAQAPKIRCPNRTAPDPDSARRCLTLLTNWRTGTLATAIAMAGLLPVAIAWHERYLITIAASIVIAAVFATGVTVARRRRLAAMALSPDLVAGADLAGERRRLQSARTRRALAAGLRRTADSNQPPIRFDLCLVLVNRAQAVRAELLALADALEQTHTPDPASVALVRELLTNGTSPLYNPNLPADDLHTILIRVGAGITNPTQHTT